MVLDKYMWEKPYDCVTINNELGVYEAISYLKEMGHKDIGYLHVVHNANNFLDRYFGFLTAVQKLEIPFQKKFLVELNTSGGEVLQMETFQAFQKMKEMPTAFLLIMIFWQFMQCNHCKDLDTEYLKIYPLLDLITWHYQKYWNRH